MTRAILWDMDGTLMDTEDLYCQAMSDLHQKHNLVPLAEEPLGACMPELFNILKAQNQHLPFSFVQWQNEVVNDVFHRLTPDVLRKDIPHILKTFHEQGIKQSIVTNSPKSFTEVAIKKLGIATYFQHVVTRDDVAQGKPNAEPYLTSLKRHAVYPNEAFAIEDSAIGIQAAQNAGLRSISVTCPKGNPQNHHGATHVIRSNKEILGIVT